jgi:hypothetical protein
MIQSFRPQTDNIQETLGRKLGGLGENVMMTCRIRLRLRQQESIMAV